MSTQGAKSYSSVGWKRCSLPRVHPIGRGRMTAWVRTTHPPYGLRRAAKAARELSKMTGTPFYVMERGKIVDLNPGGKPKRRPGRRTP